MDSLRTNDISPVVRCTYWLARFVILRRLGLVYLVAFLTAAKQIVPLIGAKGLLPVGQFLARVRKSLGLTQAGFVRRPSLFWWNHSDAALLATAWTGVALSAVVLCGWSNALVLAVLWLLYMSFVHAGQNWYGYGWEVQLLETGFRERAGRVVEPRKTRTLAAAAFRGRPAPRLAAPSGGLAEPR